MTNEEAISVIENEIQIDVRLCTGEQVDRFQTALYMEISALRAEPTGDALTLEQLREMDGKPVWIERNESPHDGKWFIVDHADIENPDRTLYTKEGVTYSDYGVHFTAYAYPPAHIDREAWEKPCNMCGGKTTLYQHTNTTKLFMNTFGNAATLVTECTACPPYADCCMKDISANSAFKINFCPECGRPLTEEAWAELKKRMGV